MKNTKKIQILKKKKSFFLVINNIYMYICGIDKIISRHNIIKQTSL